jgi:hypothetical protein
MMLAPVLFAASVNGVEDCGVSGFGGVGRQHYRSTGKHACVKASVYYFRLKLWQKQFSIRGIKILCMRYLT